MYHSLMEFQEYKKQSLLRPTGTYAMKVLGLWRVKEPVQVFDVKHQAEFACMLNAAMLKCLIYISPHVVEMAFTKRSFHSK